MLESIENKKIPMISKIGGAPKEMHENISLDIPKNSPHYYEYLRHIDIHSKDVFEPFSNSSGLEVVGLSPRKFNAHRNEGFRTIFVW